MNFADGTLITLEIMGEILAKHKLWTEGKPDGVRASLDGARLDGASLDGASLDGASLYGASLVRASLVRASLVRASLDGASLDGARLDGASLDGASLDGASLYGASLYGASLNWQSHALVSHLLFVAANGDIDRERWAGWILLRTDLCWDKIVAAIPPDQLAWGLRVLAAYVQNGDKAPEVLVAAKAQLDAEVAKCNS